MKASSLLPRLIVATVLVLATASLWADVSVSKWAANDQPVVSGEGTATISRKVADGGSYAVLASGATLPWTDATGGLCEGSNYVYKSKSPASPPGSSA